MNDFYVIAPTNNDLYHHGILGQKWGKRNGPPYPLDGSDHSASEKKAGYKKSIGGGRNPSLYAENKKSNNLSDRYNKYKQEKMNALKKSDDHAQASNEAMNKLNQNGNKLDKKTASKLEKQMTSESEEQIKSLNKAAEIEREWVVSLYTDKSIKDKVKKISKMEDDLDKVYDTGDYYKIKEAEKEVTKACVDLGKEICQSLPKDAIKAFDGRSVREGIRELNYIKMGKRYAPF